MKAEIGDIKTDNKIFAEIENLSIKDSLNFLPDFLRLFLQTLIVHKDSDLKIAAIGQAIIQASRPRSVQCPLQLALGIQLHSQYASHKLIESLHSMGLCCSFKTARKFEKSASVTEGTDVHISEGSFIQYVADNVDHNICTLDGHGTFHGMGIIAAITPNISSKRKIENVNVTAADINKVAGINIKYHKAVKSSTLIRYVIPEQLSGLFVKSNLDLLWKCSILFGRPIPSWAGVMPVLHTGNHPGQSCVKFLPMIDLNPGDFTCIYSTLSFVADHAKKFNCTPIITFDQPLWWKAMLLVAEESHESDLKSLVIRLGGFHAEMSFLGAIGALMAGSGLPEVLQTVYASVEHLLSGKAISRAVRGHLLVDQVLNGLIISEVLNDSASSFDDDTDIIAEIEKLYEDSMRKEVSIQEVLDYPILQVLDGLIDAAKESMKESRTSQLWFQYSDMIYIL